MLSPNHLKIAVALSAFPASWQGARLTDADSGEPFTTALSFVWTVRVGEFDEIVMAYRMEHDNMWVEDEGSTEARYVVDEVVVEDGSLIFDCLKLESSPDIAEAA